MLITGLLVWIPLAYSSSPVSGTPGQGETVLFLGSGVGDDGRSQVLSLPDLASIPTNMKPHPFKKVFSDGSSVVGISATVAAVVDDALVVCGGMTSYKGGEDVPLEDTLPAVSDKCYTLTDGTDWKPAPSMLEKRQGAAAAKTSDGWWVTGGSEDTSTEILKNGAWVPGPELPEAVFYHCLLQLNSEQHLLVGGGVKVGKDKYHSSGTYILQDGGYVQVEGAPKMGMGSACAMLGNEAYIAGGADPKTFEGISKVHIWSDGTWKEGPELPEALFGASLVAYDNQLYLLGGFPIGGSAYYNKIVYKLNNGEWTSVDSPDSTGTYSFPALLVSKQIIQ